MFHTNDTPPLLGAPGCPPHPPPRPAHFHPPLQSRGLRSTAAPFGRLALPLPRTLPSVDGGSCSRCLRRAYSARFASPLSLRLSTNTTASSSLPLVAPAASL